LRAPSVLTPPPGLAAAGGGGGGAAYIIGNVSNLAFVNIRLRHFSNRSRLLQKNTLEARGHGTKTQVFGEARAISYDH
jgi:hypothetical protein